jgi:K(+)-stimulated pyrophosphate-energized sodium pump
MTDTLLYVALFAGVAALVLAVYYARAVLATPRGSERMVEISDAIREGAMAFLRREYTWVAVFVAAMGLLIGFLLADGGFRALAYLFGAILSAGAGFVGMRIATAANSRTTEAARLGGIQGLCRWRFGAVPSWASPLPVSDSSESASAI